MGLANDCSAFTAAPFLHPTAIVNCKYIYFYSHLLKGTAPPAVARGMKVLLLSVSSSSLWSLSQEHELKPGPEFTECSESFYEAVLLQAAIEKMYIYIRVHTWIIVAEVISPVNLSPICTQCVQAAFTQERKIIQWLRLVWALRHLGLILPSATVFILIHIVCLCLYVPWKGHRGHCLSCPSKPDLNPH